MLGTTEIIIIGLVVVLLFGASAIPKLAKSLGQAKKEFNKGIDDAKDSSVTKESLSDASENLESKESNKES